jgi:hypothetical protein
MTAAPAPHAAIEYELRLDDLVAFNVFHNRTSLAARRQYLLGLWTFPVMWTMLCVIIWRLADHERGEPLQTFLALLPLFCGGPLHLLLYPWRYRRKLRRIVKGMVAEGHNRGILGRRSLLLGPEGIVERTEQRTATYQWSGIERHVLYEVHLFIYTSALDAIVVPKRAFASQGDFEKLHQTMCDYLNTQGATNPATQPKQRI